MGRGMLGLVSLALAAVPQEHAREQASPLASGIIKSVELSGSPDTSVRHFRLDKSSTALGPDAPEPLGVLRWICGPDPSGKGARLEIEATFFQERVLVIHSERLREDELSLTWREVGASGGRTLSLRGSREGTFTIADSSVKGTEKRSVPGSAGEFPLAFLEVARRGGKLPVEVALFDPASGAFESVNVISRSPPRSAERVLELVRADGSLRTRARFIDGEWSEWCWQEGGLVARSIGPEEYMRRLDEYHAERKAAKAQDASALSQIPPGRCTSRTLPGVRD